VAGFIREREIRSLRSGWQRVGEQPREHLSVIVP
jgi:hypothetical protein